MKTIFEDEEICITTTGHDWDFIAIIENKTDKDLRIAFDGNDDLGYEEQFLDLKKNNYIGILADNLGRFLLKQIKTKNFCVFGGIITIRQN